VARLTAGRLDPSAARHHLHDLVAVYDKGLCEPLPIYCATSAAYAGKRGAAAAAKAWDSARYPGECADPEHQLVLGRVVPFDELDGPLFAEYARRLWTGILTTEELEDR
jgi:exodeoxyribonuclease V gamma subunit